MPRSRNRPDATGVDTDGGQGVARRERRRRRPEMSPSPVGRGRPGMLAASMVPTDRILTFAAAAFVLIVVPGPSVLFEISRAVALGRRAGLATVAGNVLGQC